MMRDEQGQHAEPRGAIAQARRSQQHLFAQYAVTSILAEAPTLQEAARDMLRVIGESLDWELGLFWTVEEAAGELRFVDLWHTPRIDAAEFLQDSRSRTFSRGVGLAGRVWAEGRSVWIPDIGADAGFRRALPAAKVGFHGAVAFPVRKGPRIYGILEFFSHEIRRPDQEVLAMMTDIGIKVGQVVDREQTTQALREAEALAEVARLVGDIGHDIKNLLMPIQAGGALLKQELDECFGKLPANLAGEVKASRDAAHGILDMIGRGTDRIQGRVKEIGDSIKGVTQPPQFAPCRIADVVANVYETLRILAQERNVSLQEEGLDGLPQIQADESRLFNALYNLVNNAIPEVPHGGSITVRGWVDPTGTTVSLSVVDTGRGMPPEVRDALFTYHARSRKVGGTGLGTKIVKDVVDAHHGRITVESEPGRGTSFHLTLPVQAPSSSFEV